VVKLVRTLMIIPVCAGLAWLASRKPAGASASASASAGASASVGAGPAAASAASACAATSVGAGVVTGGGLGPGNASGSAAVDGPGRANGAARMRARRALTLVPWFLIGFLVLAAANSAGLIPVGAHGGIGQLATFLIAVALSAIGLSTDVAALRRAGARPLVLGGLLWVTVAATSLGLQALTGTLH
jgi:uncharacterized membrane protein YadS